MTSNLLGTHSSDPVTFGKAPRVHPGLGTLERALQLASALEEMERAGEVAVAGHREVHVLKKICFSVGKSTRDFTL